LRKYYRNNFLLHQEMLLRCHHHHLMRKNLDHHHFELVGSIFDMVDTEGLSSGSVSVISYFITVQETSSYQYRYLHQKYHLHHRDLCFR
jgi:hypothetical protein